MDGLENVRALKRLVNSLEIELKRIKSTQIKKGKVKDLSKEIIDFFFREVRQPLEEVEWEEETYKLSNLMEDLLDLLQKSGSTNKYRKIVKDINKLLLTAEKIYLFSYSNPKPQSKVNITDLAILTTLKQMLPSAHDSYKQALFDIDNSNRDSWRGTATDMREALREVLDYLAPNIDVMSQQHFKLEKNMTEPTMKQKVKFVLSNRNLHKNAIDSSSQLIELIETITGSFVRSVYNRANVSTHIKTELEEVKKLRNYIRLCFCELLSIT